MTSVADTSASQSEQTTALVHEEGSTPRQRGLVEAREREPLPRAELLAQRHADDDARHVEQHEDQEGIRRERREVVLESGPELGSSLGVLERASMRSRVPADVQDRALRRPREGGGDLL